MRRVVVTGMGGLTALGQRWETVQAALAAGKTATRQMPEWAHCAQLNTRLAAPIDALDIPAHYSRKTLRAMGRVALLGVRATELALEDAGLLGQPELQNGRCGIAYGSSSGSMEPVRAFGRLLEDGNMQGVTSTSYIQMMAHTAAVNIGLYFGMKGRIIPTCSACTSGSQAIGFAFESIRAGRQALMLAGGADELSPASAAVFDTLFATSTRNDTPATTPRPFDRDRDGLVVGEGAGTLVLEEREHALARGARIYAELLGFGCNSDGSHVTQPEASTMAVAMRLALDDAGLAPAEIGYVSAHGTATERGDIAESQATAAVFGRPIPISSLKSYFGHTLGACGAIEAWLGIEMLRRDWYAPTVNLEVIDPRCGELDYLQEPRSMQHEYLMSNNFAFGGINTSLIFQRQ